VLVYDRIVFVKLLTGVVRNFEAGAEFADVE
jgi:hypothetical protein